MNVCDHAWSMKFIDGSKSTSDWECEKCHEYCQVAGMNVPKDEDIVPRQITAREKEVQQCMFSLFVDLIVRGLKEDEHFRAMDNLEFTPPSIEEMREIMNDNELLEDLACRLKDDILGDVITEICIDFEKAEMRRMFGVSNE